MTPRQAIICAYRDAAIAVRNFFKHSVEGEEEINQGKKIVNDLMALAEMYEKEETAELAASKQLFRWVRASQRQPEESQYFPIRFWGIYGYAHYTCSGHWSEEHKGTLKSEEVEWLEEVPDALETANDLSVMGENPLAGLIPSDTRREMDKEAIRLFQAGKDAKLWEQGAEWMAWSMMRSAAFKEKTDSATTVDNFMLRWVKASDRQPPPGIYPVRVGARVSAGGATYYSNGLWVDGFRGPIKDDNLYWLEC